MVKFLKCAYCEKIFRGERRRPCSNLILTLLRRKFPESRASSADFVHNSCRVKLQINFQVTQDTKQQVLPFHIQRQIKENH